MVDWNIILTMIVGLGSGIIKLLIPDELPFANNIKWASVMLVMTVLMSIINYIRDKKSGMCKVTNEDGTQSVTRPDIVSVVARSWLTGAAVVAGGVMFAVLWKILSFIPILKPLDLIVSAIERFGLSVNEMLTILIVYIIVNMQVNKDFVNIVCKGEKNTYFLISGAVFTVFAIGRPIVEYILSFIPGVGGLGKFPKKGFSQNSNTYGQQAMSMVGQAQSYGQQFQQPYYGSGSYQQYQYPGYR